MSLRVIRVTHHVRPFIVLLIIGVAIAGTAVWVWPKQNSNAPQVAPTKQQTPATSPPPAPPSFVDQTLAGMSLRDKVASLFILHTPGSDPTTLASYETTYKPSGLIFMGDNIPATLAQLTAETQALTTNKALPPLLAVDEEGDTVKRLAADTFHGALTLPDMPPAATADAFAKRSDLLKSVGLNLNFGIIADVTSNPASFIFPRVLGTTPQQAADRVAQAVLGSKNKTLSTLKHFPGHGETTADSHISIPATNLPLDTWKQRDALPFKAGIAAGADVVMFGQLRYTAVDQAPAALSATWHNIIKNDLGFKGLTITDDMIMLQDSGEAAYADPVNNAVAAIQAGNDLLLYVLNHDSTKSKIDPATLINGVVAAVTSGRITEATIDAHARAVIAARHSLGQILYGVR